MAKMINSILNLMQKREAFESCKIEGLVPQHWTFTDYLMNENKQESKKTKAKKNTSISNRIFKQNGIIWIVAPTKTM
jgi:hypothetical protein